MYFILTTKSFMWVVLSLISTMISLSAINSPKWLVGPKYYNCSSPQEALSENINNTTDLSHKEVRCYPSEGVFYQCKKINDHQYCSSFAVEGLAVTDPMMFPTMWKIAFVLLSVSIFINFLMSIMAISSFCKQAICKKSVFGLAGCGQGLAGFLYLIGVICFAAGWGSESVVILCGARVDPFVSANCTTGSGLYTAGLAVFLTFATAMLSGPADQATSSDKVAHQLEQGENVVFLL